jgi:hypothetical protein
MNSELTQNYSRVIASTGQLSTQTPQSMQASLTTALPSAILMASLGQSSAQVSQPVHLLLSTLADICVTFLKYIVLILPAKGKMLQNYSRITTIFLQNPGEKQRLFAICAAVAAVNLHRHWHRQAGLLV